VCQIKFLGRMRIWIDAHHAAELVHKGTRWILLIDHLWPSSRLSQAEVPPGER
jgi:hypothetical protein